jgi:ribosomal protein L24E
MSIILKIFKWMRCPYCGNKTMDGSGTCHVCGYKEAQ